MTSIDIAPPTPDLQFAFDGGSIVLCTPRTPAAQEWIAEHVEAEAIWLGSSLCIEARYLDDFVSGARNDGLTCEADE